MPLQFRSKINDIIVHNDMVKSFDLEIPQNIDWYFIPGQYIDLGLDEDPSHFSGFSLTSDASERSKLSITVKLADTGDLTHKLFQKKVGDSVIIKGPSGTFTLDLNSVPALILIGGGIGVTPLISMFRTSASYPKRVNTVLFHSAKTSSDLVFHDELRNLAESNEYLTYFPTVTQDLNWYGEKSRITLDDVLKIASSKPFKDCLFFICGPDSMNTDFKNGLIVAGFNSDRIYLESYYEP